GQAAMTTPAAILRQTTEPLSDKTRQMLVQSIDDIVERHAAPLLGQLRQILRESLEEVIRDQMEPMLQRARQGMQESAQLAAQFADVMASRLKPNLAEPAGAELRQQVP